MSENKQGGAQALLLPAPSKDLYLDKLMSSAPSPVATHIYPMNRGKNLEHESERLELNEQFYAQVAALSVKVPHAAIAEGIRKTLNTYKLHRKTKQEWNAERVRDFRVFKEQGQPSKPSAEEPLALLDAAGGASSHSFADVPTDPIPFLRNYQFDAYDDALRLTNRRHGGYGAIRVLDLAGQLVGDSRLSDLIYQLRRCPLEVLNLSQNNVTDKGMAQLATCLRSLGSLRALVLQHNVFTDAGVESIFQPNTYSPTLRKLDISCNAMGSRAAFAIGRMFRPEVRCELDALLLGGRLGKRGWGDEFLRILVDLLCRRGARPIRVLSYPQAAITADGVRAIASLVVCATQLRTLNLTKNSLQDAASRRMLRDALRASSSVKEVYVGSAGIQRHERAELEAAAHEPATAVTWKEKVDLTYAACKELNACFKLSSALELIITNNWQAARPPAFPTLEPYVATKEDIARAMSITEEDGGDRDDLQRIASGVPIPVPLVFLASNMRLQASLTRAMGLVDSVCSYITTLKRSYALCLNWLRENVDGFRLQGDHRVACRRFQGCEAAALKKRGFLLGALEKWTSVSLAKIVLGVDGKIRKVREKRAQSYAGGRAEKKGKINAESVAMCIDDLHSAYIEAGDCLQVLIGVTFAVKLRYQEIQGQLLAGRAAFDSSKPGAVAKQASKVRGDLAGLLPYASLLGLAAMYIHYIYVAGPEEIERVQKSIVAFERDQKKQAEVAAKGARRAHLAGRRKVGARLRVLRPWEIEERNERLGYDPQERADQAVQLAAQIKQRAEEEADARAEALRLRAEEEAGGAGEDSELEDEDTEEDEEEEEESEEKKEGGGRTVVRERTRFLVPKRDLQKRYSDLFVEALQADRQGTKSGVVAFSRSCRRHAVTAIPLHLEMPSDDFSRQVPVDVLLEAEEERADPLQPLARLDCIRPFVRLQERIRHNKATSKYIREEALDM